MQDTIEVDIGGFVFCVDKKKFMDENTFEIIGHIPDFIKQLIPPCFKVIERIEEPEELNKKGYVELATK